MAREFNILCWRSALASISAEQVGEWKTYFAKHGFSYQMDNWRMAMICANNWNATMASVGRLEEPVSATNFMPTHSEPEQSIEPTEQELMAMSESAGGMRFECPDS